MRYTELLLFLRQHSYRETPDVLQSGDFAVHGDTIQWWPVSETAAYRHHFFGEDLEKAERREGEGWKPAGGEVPLMANELATEHGTVRPGEYIVHPHHGVGIFEYLVTRGEGSARRSFVSLQYAGGDRLLFPLDKQAELMPYIGSRQPRLTRLYSKSWQHTKEKVQKDLIKVARELLKIYAQRQLSDRPPYRFSQEWEQKLLDSAGFELTEDQARALAEIRADMEGSNHPMDRLVCGDVGFGKTELAMQAAAQVLQAGRQVAFIAPTTVLVEQHFALLQRRFGVLPVRVEHMSRLTAAKDKELVGAMRDGSVDMVVGTHRLLGKDVEFKDLGLLIVDEEQKFGVQQKERLKELRPNVDVLTLSATPIPRTLSMSLSGLRGLSILRTPPHGRRPVETMVQPYGDTVLQEALGRELGRDGQVYVVHNRVQSILPVALRVTDQLRQLGYEPELYDGKQPLEAGERGSRRVVAVAHGQLDEVWLSRIMGEFLKGRIDVLVASSIVEHGLDSPGANTLVVLHSEWFGLSDLYQLRGRVGRRQTQAYAYFLLGGVGREGAAAEPELPNVSDLAKQRLKALQEADALGSGWSVALRDLEIRGGGNILGTEQHGSMEAIGLLLYAQLLQEEIGRQAKRMRVPLFQRSLATE